MCRGEDVDPTNLLFARHWLGGARGVEPGRFGRRQQGLVPDLGEAAHRVRQPREGNGGERAILCRVINSEPSLAGHSGQKQCILPMF